MSVRRSNEYFQIAERAAELYVARNVDLFASPD